MNPRVIKVVYKSPYQLILTFANFETKAFDLSTYLNYPIFIPLQNESLCANAKVFNGTVVWNDDIDFDPDRLYLVAKAIEFL
jgi:hypothetical protein